MHSLLILGAGKIGSAIAKLLARSGDYQVRVADVSEGALHRLDGIANLEVLCANLKDPSVLASVMHGREAAVSALSFDLNPAAAQVAAENGLSYFDLTEDVDTRRRVQQIAKSARPGQIFMPQCGLAPGFISIAAFHLVQQFDKLDEVRLRVGALPKFPTNEMKYNLTWSTDGLINEYGNPCEAIHNGEQISTLPLEGLEHFSLDGIDYEAFNTSGGVGTLCDSLAGNVRTLNYKTVRYRGHRDYMAFLMIELRLNDRRAVLKNILETAVPMTLQDVVLIFCTANGWKDGRLQQITDARKIYHGEIAGESWSAIQLTTASSLCAVVDLHFHGKLPKQGFVRQEQVSLPEFLKNRFGMHYAVGGEPSVLAGA
jgi:saccharopine dehydrogenase-like NADP-dependent oxidoreductase